MLYLIKSLFHPLFNQFVKIKSSIYLFFKPIYEPIQYTF